MKRNGLIKSIHTKGHLDQVLSGAVIDRMYLDLTYVQASMGLFASKQHGGFVTHRLGAPFHYRGAAGADAGG